MISIWDIWVFKKKKQLVNNIMLHHSGPHSHFIKACGYLNVCYNYHHLTYLTAQSNGPEFFFCCYYLHIYTDVLDLLWEVIWLWQVSSLAGEGSQLNVAVMTSGRPHWLLVRQSIFKSQSIFIYVLGLCKPSSFDFCSQGEFIFFLRVG